MTDAINMCRRVVSPLFPVQVVFPSQLYVCSVEDSFDSCMQMNSTFILHVSTLPSHGLACVFDAII